MNPRNYIVALCLFVSACASAQTKSLSPTYQYPPGSVHGEELRELLVEDIFRQAQLVERAFRCKDPNLKDLVSDGDTLADEFDGSMREEKDPHRHFSVEFQGIMVRRARWETINRQSCIPVWPNYPSKNLF